MVLQHAFFNLDLPLKTLPFREFDKTAVFESKLCMSPAERSSDLPGLISCLPRRECCHATVSGVPAHCRGLFNFCCLSSIPILIKFRCTFPYVMQPRGNMQACWATLLQGPITAWGDEDMRTWQAVPMKYSQKTCQYTWWRRQMETFSALLGPVLLTLLRHVARILANGRAAFFESCDAIGSNSCDVSQKR